MGTFPIVKCMDETKWGDHRRTRLLDLCFPRPVWVPQPKILVVF